MIASRRHERVACPSTATVQAPQAPCSHPRWVAVRRHRSRRKSARVSRGSTSQVTLEPFNSSVRDFIWLVPVGRLVGRSRYANALSRRRPEVRVPPHLLRLSSEARLQILLRLRSVQPPAEASRDDLQQPRARPKPDHRGRARRRKQSNSQTPRFYAPP